MLVGMKNIPSDPLLTLVIHASIVLVLVVAVLVLVLLVIKFVVVVYDRDVAKAKRRLEPIFEQFVSGTAPLPAALTGVRWPLRGVLQYVVIHRSFGAEEPALKRIQSAYKRLGFIDVDHRRLKSLFWWVRAEGARCLGQLKVRGAKPQLLRLLGDPTLEVRLLSSWALGRLGDADTLQPIIDALAKDSRVAAMRLSSTVFEIGPRAVEPLIRLLRNPDPAQRLLVVHLLGELGDKKALPSIADRAKSDEDKEVRIAAYKALGTIADPSTRDLLIAGLGDPLWEIRAQAARGLALLGSPAAVGALARCLEDPVWWVRRNAGEALSKLGAAGKEALLKAQREASSQMTKEIAAQWLDEIESLPTAH